ncbi:hypothetical protein CSUI_004387, partial [Cystoisospora suis]
RSPKPFRPSRNGMISYLLVPLLSISLSFLYDFAIFLFFTLSATTPQE